jgi:hypothetical protein
MTGQEDLEQLYGPAATHSEHWCGEDIRYRLPGEGEFSGTIILVGAPIIMGSQPVGLRYIVTSNGAASFPDIVFPADVLA